MKINPIDFALSILIQGIILGILLTIAWATRNVILAGIRVIKDMFRKEVEVEIKEAR